jgi:hypothetical protein
VFRWRPGRDARYKKSEVCQTCSKLKNVCQVCLLDLEYGLPVQVRDTALGINTSDAIPKSDVNREYFAEEQDRKVLVFASYFPFLFSFFKHFVYVKQQCLIRVPHCYALMQEFCKVHLDMVVICF